MPTSVPCQMFMMSISTHTHVKENIMQACDYTFVSFTAGLVLVDPMRDAIADMTARADRAIADALVTVKTTT